MIDRTCKGCKHYKGGIVCSKWGTCFMSGCNYKTKESV